MTCTLDDVAQLADITRQPMRFEGGPADFGPTPVMLMVEQLPEILNESACQRPNGIKAPISCARSPYLR